MKVATSRTAAPKKFFYASMCDGRRKALLAGPYETHAEAKRALPHAKRKAEVVNPIQCSFASFGTAGSDEEFKTVFGRIEL